MRNLLMGAYLSSGRPAETMDNLNSVYESFPVLKDRTDQKAGSLSGGEQQMLAIARAMMANPKNAVGSTNLPSALSPSAGGKPWPK